MKIILRKNINNLGNRGDVLQVKSGYARNYLIPQGLAFVYSKGNLKRFEEEKKYLKKIEEQNIEQAKQLKIKLENESITIKQKSHDNDELYGSVNKNMIAEELNKRGYEIKESAIDTEPIKKLGIYDIPVKIYSDIIANIKVWVVKDE